MPSPSRAIRGFGQYHSGPLPHDPGGDLIASLPVGDVETLDAVRRLLEPQPLSLRIERPPAFPAA